MPLMSFGRALPVGMESRAEWFAITLRTPMSAAEVHTRLAAALPTGMAVIRVEEVDKSRRTEQSVAETFRLRTGSIDGEGLSLAAVRDCFAAFAAQESVMLTRETKKGPRTSDIRRHLLRWKELEDGSLEFSDLGFQFIRYGQHSLGHRSVIAASVLRNGKGQHT